MEASVGKVGGGGGRGQLTCRSVRKVRASVGKVHGGASVGKVGGGGGGGGGG